MCTNEFGEGQVSASLPQKKCRALLDKARFFAQTRWCARKDLERFMGHLAFASRLVRGLSLFRGSGHALSRSKQRWLQMTGGACADFRFVAECLELYNGQQPELQALPQEPFYPFRDDASSRINYLELFSVFWALKLWGEVLRGLTVVLITDNTPTKGMLEKWRCTPDFRKLLRAVFKQCVCFDVRFIVEWVPSKENQFADALSRKEMSLFFDLHQEWKATSIWRQDKDDWKLFSEVFDRLDKRPSVFFPVERFEAETNLFSALEVGEEEKRELEDGLAHYTVIAVAVNTRSAYETGGKQFCRFAVWYGLRPVFPASEHSLELWATFLARSVKYSTIKAYLSAVRNLHLDLGFTLPEFEEMPHLRRTLRGIKRLKENPKRKKLGIGPKELVSIFFDGRVDPSKENDLFCWLACLLAFGGCFRKANVTAKKEDAFSRSGVMLRGSVRRGATTLAFAEHMPRGLIKHWGDWVSDAMDEYHDMSLEQRLAIPKLVSDSMVAAVDARC
eukprot:gene4192-biopygen4129